MSLLRNITKVSNFFAFQRRSFIIKTLDDVKRENLIVTPFKGCESRRYLLRKDGMGFSMHETVLHKGYNLFMHYKNHVEAVFITKGSGWIEVVERKEDLGKGKRYEVFPGTMYALNGHESHFLSSEENEITVLCVFVPPCDGKEVYNDEGVYPVIGEDGIPDYDYWEKHKKTGKPIVIELKCE